MDHLKNLHILIVDDNESIHGDYKKILLAETSSAELDDLEAELFGSENLTDSRVSFILDSAFQGQEAVDKVVASMAKGEPYALAFVDMRMPPGWDGLRTIREIWTKDPDLLVVICTAYSDYSWDEVRKEVGYTDRLLILKKPFETAEVYQLAVALTEKWRLARAANLRLDQLEVMVKDRTAELIAVQRALSAAVAGLEIQATTDGLTGLKNHRAFQEYLASEWERTVRYESAFTVVLMDIDQFKAYNDTFGHIAGDEVLKRIGALLIEQGRKGDFIARYGGEEFVIVMHNTDSDSADAGAERLRRSIDEATWPNRKITASFGMSQSSSTTATASELVHEADQALYHSKRRGRNCVTRWQPDIEQLKAA